MVDKPGRFPFWRTYATIFFCILSLAAVEIARQLNSLGVIFSLKTFWWLVVTGALLLSALGILTSWTVWLPRLSSRFSIFHKDYWPQKRILLWGVVFALSTGFSLWVLTRGFIVLNGFYSRVFIFILISSIGALFLRPMSPGGSWKIALASSMLITAAVFKGLIYILPGISTSPFSLSWSEGSRYYFGSLLFSEKLYGVNLPPSPWHASRYMLMALPFIFNGLPIWVHRFWQVCLWIGLSGWAGYLLAKRLRIKHRLLILSFSAWVFLFLNLGPVYYHLVICVILIYWGVNFDKPGKTMVVLILASIWAGLSRINWIPVPTFLVVTLYFLERPWDRARQGWRYIVQPLLWGTGLVAAFFSYLVYIKLSGNLASKFGSSFTSDLLWNRLWPNPTFQLGILLGAVAASAPLWFMIYFRLRGTFIYRNRIKWFVYAGMVLSLFLGGLIVSVKGWK